MTAWGRLILNSVLPSGTAWQHLHNQAGGGVIVNDGIAVEVDTMPIEIEVQSGELEIEVIDAPIEVEIDLEPISLEITE